MAQLPKGGLERSYDKPIHGSCAIYFPDGIVVFQVPPTGVSFGACSHSEGFGANWHVCLWGSLGQMSGCFRKGSLEGSPTLSLYYLYIWSPVSCGSLRQMAGASEMVFRMFHPTVFLYIRLPLSCHPLRQVLLWRVTPAVFLYMCLPVSCRFPGHMALTLEKVQWKVLPSLLCICRLLLLSGAKGCCFRKRFGGFPQLFFTFAPVSLTLHSALLLEHF